MTATTKTLTVLGDLQPHAPSAGVRPCIDTRELREGDTVFASGFARGDRRRVLEVRIAPPFAYLRVAEGWYRYRHVYVNVLEF